MKKINIGVIVLTLLIVAFSSSLAFYAAKIVGNGKNVDVIAKNVSIKLTNGGLIGDAVITPGWSKTNTFTITNNSKENFRYNIIIKDYINTFETVGNLQYKITSDNNGYNMSDFEELPKAIETRDLVLAYNISIDKDTTQNYTVELRYVDSEEDQSVDMGKTLGGTLYITENTNKIVTYNNGSIGSKLLSDNTTKLTRASFDSVYTKTNTNTLFTSIEDDTLVYYFAGDAKNNWVKFGTWSEDKTVVIGSASSLTAGVFGKSYSTMSECTSANDFNLNCTTVELAKKGDPMYWRIIRTNTDGSLKLLYAGTSVTSETAYIGMNVFNSNANNPMYVGYMYGTSGNLENNRTNTNDSFVKTLIDSWYKTNLLSYEDYISNEAVYCNDRSVTSGSYELGTNFFYSAYTRLKTNKTPTYNCSAKEDKFSVSNTTGNGKLTYPIALMTADEYAYAGGNKEMSLNSPYAYYYSNSLGKSSVGESVWWLMSPYLNTTSNYAGVNTGTGYYTNSEGNLGYNDPTYSNAIRPVISINADAVYKSGDGSSASPYEIEATASYEVTLTVNNGTGSGKVTVKEGNNATFTVTPNSGYKAELDTNSCGGTLSENTYTVSNVTGNKTCSITFKKDTPPEGSTLVTAVKYFNPNVETRTDFSSVLTSDTTGTIFTSTENGTTVFYFAGNTDKNWIKFGKNSSEEDLYWRIIRTNADGGIRLLYHSTSPTAEDAYIGDSAFNSTYDDSKYVGYMYDSNAKDSTIKDTIDSWYEKNLTNYTKYLSTTAIYCNDRQTTDGTYFGAYNRVNTKKEPSYECTNISDAFSVSNTSAKLTYPIGLMTADEISFAGGLTFTSAPAYYYYNSSKGSSTGAKKWFTMSPSDWRGSLPRMFSVRGSGSSGLLESMNVELPFSIRPVTSLKSCVKWKSGDGTANSPYTIDESYSC